MSEIKLKPIYCPFCGCDNNKIGIRNVNNKGYKVVCGNCGASGTYVAIKEWHDNKFIAQNQAIKQWNTRKPMDRIVERFKTNQEWLDAVIYPLNNRENTIVKKAIEIVKEEGGV